MGFWKLRPSLYWHSFLHTHPWRMSDRGTDPEVAEAHLASEFLLAADTAPVNTLQSMIMQVVVFALGVGSTAAHLESLIHALSELCQSIKPAKADPSFSSNYHDSLDETFTPPMTPREAFCAAKEMWAPAQYAQQCTFVPILWKAGRQQWLEL